MDRLQIGKITHTVTPSDGSWDSGPLRPGQSFSRTFDTPGTVADYCKPHGSPDGSGMAATLMVREVSAAEASALAAIQAQTQDAPVGIEVSDHSLEDGYINNVEVTLGPTPKPGDELRPMLHIDAGQTGCTSSPAPTRR